jgi:two-component system, OmpR family, osmolarity sensor histidine kinase EnvZ
LKVSLFWRTFLLIALLLMLSLGVGLTLVRQLDPTPPEQNLAWELASVVNLTRNALISAQPSKRRELLAVLEKEEGVRILPLEEGDRVQDLLPYERKARIEEAVHRLLGSDTIMATRVNDLRGLWVSFTIDGDRYWLVLPRQRLDRQKELPLLPVLSVLALFALAGTTIMSRLVNKPLANLADALGALGQGQAIKPLREDLASEIASVNRHFNQMTRNLSLLEADRTLALAGISHDIRTPLTRLRMEVEMASIPEAQRLAMVEDIERINEIVAQFMDYARAGRSTDKETVNVSERLQLLVQRFQLSQEAVDPDGTLKPARLNATIELGLVWQGNGTDLDRMVGNLLENARRYGRPLEGTEAKITLSAKAIAKSGKTPARLLIELIDNGRGVPAPQLRNLTKPFMRLDDARGMHEGAGLGLAIVERIAERHHGQLHLSLPASAGGFCAEISLPLP